MSWIAITDGRRSLRACEPAQTTLVTEGSLVIEACYAPLSAQPQTLVNLQRSQGWDRGFRMTLGAGGLLTVEHWQNQQMTRVRLALGKPDADAILRITYAWDGPRRLGYLSAENLDTGGLDQIGFDTPQPWPSDDIAALTGGWDDCRIDRSVSLLAVSDKVEPVGPATGLVRGTLVETAMGLRPVQDLSAGDLVLTADHGLQPVRAAVTRAVPSITSFAPIRLSAPFFGLERDLCVAPDHRILINGADAEYLFGADSVLVEARHLVGMALPSMKSEAATVSYTQLILDSHECIRASGIWVETMYLGGLSDCPLRLATSGLADLKLARLPRHTEVVSPLLKSYEAVVLVSAMCA